MIVADTERLTLRRLDESDASFIFELVNEPSWLRFIGDKGVRNLDDARRYLRDGPMTMYGKHGFGLYRVDAKDSGETVGMCGLIKRDSLDDVDIGFAFLPRARGKGYAREAAAATLAHGRRDFGLKRIVAITSLDNERSIALLESLGFVFERTIRSDLGDEVKLFASES